MNYFVVSPITVSEKFITAAGRQINEKAYSVIDDAVSYGRHIGRALYGHGQYFETTDPVPEKFKRVTPETDLLLSLLLFKRGALPPNSTVQYFNSGGYKCGEKLVHVGPPLLDIIKYRATTEDIETYYMIWQTPFGEFRTPVIDID